MIWAISERIAKRLARTRICWKSWTWESIFGMIEPIEFWLQNDKWKGEMTWAPPQLTSAWLIIIWWWFGRAWLHIDLLLYWTNFYWCTTLINPVSSSFLWQQQLVMRSWWLEHHWQELELVKWQWVVAMVVGGVQSYRSIRIWIRTEHFAWITLGQHIGFE